MDLGVQLAERYAVDVTFGAREEFIFGGKHEGLLRWPKIGEGTGLNAECEFDRNKRLLRRRRPCFGGRVRSKLSPHSDPILAT